MKRADSDVLYGSRRKYLWLLAIGVTFVAIGIPMGQSGEWIGWFVALFFGLCSVVFLANLIRPGRLELGPSGFSVYQWGRRTASYDWHRCGHFTTYSPAAGVTLVAFEYDSPATRRHPGLARANRAVAGGNSGLPETFGLPAAELRDLLEARRRKATTSRTEEPGPR